MGRRGESIFRRKDGRWEAQYPLGKDAANGKTKYRSVYGDTYSEAKEKRTQAIWIHDWSSLVKQNRELISTIVQ